MKLRPILAEIGDRRRKEGRRYDLPHVVLFTLLALLSGADSYRKIAGFIEVRFAELKALCGLKCKCAPAHTTLRDILLGLDEAELETAFRQQAAALARLPAQEVIAIDGKALRGSFDHLLDQRAAMMVSAFATDSCLALGHVMLDDEDKAGEIPAAQQLIEQLGLSGQLFSLDALHCQKNAGDRLPAGQ